MSKANVQINGYYSVKSNRILSRRVVNDANVTDWEVISDIDEFEQSVDGLKQWMHVQNLSINNEPERWDTDELRVGIAGERNPHVWDYGQRVQFWIPLARDMVEEREIQTVGTKVVCVNVIGLDELTEGREYNVESTDNELVTITNDNGQSKQYLMDRFKTVSNYDAWLEKITSFSENEKEKEEKASEVSEEIW